MKCPPPVPLFQKPNRVSGLFSASCAANRFAAAKLWPWVAVTFTTETAGAVSGVVLADAVTVKLVDQLLHCAPSLTRTHKCRYPSPPDGGDAVHNWFFAMHSRVMMRAQRRRAAGFLPGSARPGCWGAGEALRDDGLLTFCQPRGRALGACADR
jgi:hypothetical protein